MGYRGILATLGGAGLIILALLGWLVFPASMRAQPPAVRATVMHRNNFSGKDVYFQKADANLRYDLRDHKISAEHHKSAGTSEYFRIEANPPAGALDKEFVHFAYEVPPAPLTEALTVRLFVKAYRVGVQVKCRVVFPKEKDPQTPEAPLTTLLSGEVYDKVRQWQSLGLADPVDALRKHLPVLRARLGREVDSTDAFIDRVLVNVYTGPGISEVWVDDLEIGPVRGDAVAEGNPAKPPVPGSGSGSRPTLGGGRGPQKAVPVEFADGQILVDGDPFFMLAIRHTDTPLKALRDAQFNTIWFPQETANETLEEAIRHGFWIVPTLPIPGGEWDQNKPKRPDEATIQKDAEATTQYLRRFLSGDAVLMWDFGSNRTAEDLARVVRVSEVVRSFDPRRPRGVGLWDGYSAYSRYVNAIGAYRWPLFSSLELIQYKDWLEQRRALISPGKMMYSWVQTHLPEWYLQQVYGRTDLAQFEEPIGPHPEQIRILTYLSLASGARGLGFWSDQFLSKDTHNGRDRLLELALINAEIDMLRPVLASLSDPAEWVGTSDSRVQAALLRGPQETLVLPVWLGPGTQFVPPQGSLSDLYVTVSRVPESSIVWRVSPAGIDEIKDTKRTPQGLQIKVTEFDLACAIVISPDLGATGKAVRWQDHTRFRSGETAARWAQQLSLEQYDKTWQTHQAICNAGGPNLPEAAELFAKSRYALGSATEFFDNKQWDLAYRESRRALRPLREVMQGHWQAATRSLDTPTASPFAMSFYTLPRHYRFASLVARSRVGGNGLAHGDFELSRKAPEGGAAVDSLPGWKASKTVLDPVDALAAIVNSDERGIVDPPPTLPTVTPSRFAPLRIAPPVVDPRRPNLGNHTLQLRIDPKPQKDKQGQPIERTQALERAVLAVDSPPAEFAPGSLVRISFWAKLPYYVTAGADGMIAFDSAGGEPLGVRLRHAPNWQQYHLYRRVPASGKISLRFALTGFGVAYIDDIRMEPLLLTETP